MSKWFWCCSAARKYNDPDNLFIPQGSLYPSWGNMEPDDIDRWRNKGCDAVVGGSTKPNCRIGLYHFDFSQVDFKQKITSKTYKILFKPFISCRIDQFQI